MSRNILRLLLFPLLLLCGMVLQGGVYEEISKSFDAMQNRVPGSKEYYQAADLLEKTLKANGIDARRQVYPTLVPKVTKSVFQVDGKNLNIFPLAPNNVGLISTGATPLVKEFVYIKPEDLAARRYPVKDKIVFLEWGESNIREIFSEGAQAVIFIGNERATQWDVARALTHFNVSRPLFYITKAEAEANKLKDNSITGRKITLQVNTQWEQVDGVNIYAVLKSTDKEFELGRPEAIIMGARFDSFGAVPGLVSGDRDAANCALLAETLVNLSKEELDRAVVAIFHGSAYNAYDGLRNFYFPINNILTKADISLENYLKGFEEEKVKNQQLLATLESNPISNKNETLFQYECWLRLREVVVRRSNELNSVRSTLNAQQREIDKQLKALDKELGDLKGNDKIAQEKLIEAKKVKLDGRKIKLQAEIQTIEKHYFEIGQLRKQLNDRQVELEYQDIFKPFLAQVEKQLRIRQDELDISIRTAKDYVAIGELIKDYTFVAAYHFDFANDEDKLILVSQGYTRPFFQKRYSLSYYNKFFKAFNSVVEKLDLQKGKNRFVEESLSGKYLPASLSSESMQMLAGAVSLAFKVPGFNLRNAPGDYDYDQMPGKRNYDLSGLENVVLELFTAIIDAPELSMRSTLDDSVLLDKYLFYSYQNGNYEGTKFNIVNQGGDEIDGPAAGMIVFLSQFPWQRMPTLCGFSLSAFGRVNQDGYTSIPLVTIGGSWDNGKIGAHSVGGIGFDEFGQVSHINLSDKYDRLFRAYGGVMSFTYAPFTYNFAGTIDVRNGKSDASFKNSNSMARLDPGDGYLFIDRDVLSKMITSDETFVLGGTAEKPKGDGIDVSTKALLNLDINRLAVDNTILLNEERLNNLHSRNIFNSVIEEFHDEAERHYQQALEARADGNMNLARANEVFGQTLAVRAYRPLKGMINDMIRSVLILLIMTIPFSFVLERLLIGATNVYRQMFGVFVCFLLTFIALYFTHPAFKLTDTSVIIFIAFFIIVMSAVVIYIVMNRFKSELMVLQGMDTSAHRVSSENSMVLAAILIGVSSMRNRPVKTFLTILTVVLLTFTIISFASFESTGKVRQTYIGDGSRENRIETFQATHLDMTPRALYSIQDLYGKNYDVFLRAASFYSPYYDAEYLPAQENLLYNPVNGKAFKLESLVGFEPGEAKSSAMLDDLMPGFKNSKLPLPLAEGKEYQQLPLIYISPMAADELQVKAGDVIRLRSKAVKIGGIFDPLTLDSFTYMDDAKAVPPNFEATKSAEEKGRVWDVVFDVTGNMDGSSFIWCDPEKTVLTDVNTTLEMNGFHNGAILYPKNDCDMLKDASMMAAVSYGIVYSNSSGGVYRHLFSEAFSASGVGTIIVPLLLGGLIILSSLLGSIADREREIFTFSALGLSPFDVSVLFFAESGVYAIIGGLGGYLFSQFVGILLRYLASFGWVEAPEMNYSSLSTIYTILIVMVTVLLSTVYPAIKAGRAASPDVARKWQMPAPQGKKLNFHFPFTVSSVDFGGILMFISEHFKNHSDSSLGAFTAGGVEIIENYEGDKGIALKAELTLAPFDLGVAETFCMYSTESDIAGINVVAVDIEKLGGTNAAWLRANQRFVNEIRNQFLLWRSLPLETVVHYRSLAAGKIKRNEGDV